MKTSLKLCSLVLGALLALPVFAKDCATSPSPEKCLARQNAMKTMQENCKGQSGLEKKQCMRANAPKVDCPSHQNPAACEKREAAKNACKAFFGSEHKTCMKEHLRKQ